MVTIALLTDFGTRDPYVASVKGVLAARCTATIADLTHEIAPFDVWEAAWFLRTAAPWWPERTIFLCVVDPGVGTSRRILAVEREDRTYLAPDNGLLTFIGADTIVSVENESFFLPGGATTFHGRDRFAPVAAALANGTPLSELGPRAADMITLDYEPPRYAAVSNGTIVAIDRFGNCITDIERERVPFDDVLVQVGTTSIARYETTYTGSEPFLITGSSGMIEISIANGSAAQELGVARGDRVSVEATTEAQRK